MKFIGTTETYDPCYVNDWETRLQDANIIISKELTNDMIYKLVKYQDKIIFHHTVTGNGATSIEPGVKSCMHEFLQFGRLIASGFPTSHYVLRIDPIIPIPRFIQGTIQVLDAWSNWASSYSSKIRCRVSVIDLYPHVKDRFKKLNITDLWSTFHAPQEIFNHLNDLLNMYQDSFIFESCGEPGFTFPGSIVGPRACASAMDLSILRIDNPSEYSIPNKPQRDVCYCLSKKQILGVKPGRCPHECAYCYWKD